MSIQKFTGNVTTAAGTVENVSMYVVEQTSLPRTREYSPEELREAFKLVAPKPNWKDPIDTEIDEANMEIVDRAIAFMAYGGAEFAKLGNGRVRVTAPGYWGMEGILEAQRLQMNDAEGPDTGVEPRGAASKNRGPG